MLALAVSAFSCQHDAVLGKATLMLLQVLAILILLQEPAVPTAAASSAQEAAAPAPAPAPEAAPPARSRQERRAEVVCENRPRTGSVMTRRICRSARRADAERIAAQVYVEQVTAGTLNEPPPQ